jgi:hypothetical protein
MRIWAADNSCDTVAGLTAAILLACLAGIMLPASAHADSIGGFLEYGYSRNKSTTTDSSGETTDTDSNSFLQRYFLSLDRTIYPQLRFSGGGIFEKFTNNATSDGIDSDSEATRFVPRAELTLSNPFYNAGIGYTRREDSSESDGVSTPTAIVETISSRLGFKPVGLPTLDLLYTRTNYFDEDRELRDTTNDAYSLFSNYKPTKDLEVSYLGQYTKQTDKLNDREITSTTHNGRVSYSREFLEGRASFAGTYNITQQNTENQTLIASPLPITAAVARSASPPAGTDITSFDFSTPTPILTNGSGTDIQSGLLIGSTASLTPEASHIYHFGLDLQIAAPTNTIFLTVGPSVELTTAQILAVTAQFDWSVYASNDNAQWTLVTGPQKFPFRPTGSIGVLDNSYELTFPDTTARYFKVVVQPLRITPPPSTTGPIELYVTELRSFVRISETTKSTSTDSLFQILNLNGRVLLFEPGTVTYEFFYNLNKSETDFFNTTRYTISNALRAQHRFNRILTGAARVSREDTSDPQEDRVAYIYSASLQATPFPTLSHTLVYSGRTESGGNKETSSNNSIFLSNFASPYPGVDLNLLTGYTTNTSDTGQKTDSLTLSIGSSFVPNPKLTLNINYAGTNTKQSGGGTIDQDKTTQRGDVGVSFTPVPAIYLNATYGVQTETDRDRVEVQSYGGSWAIFRDGALQLNITYSETISPTTNEKFRSFSPSLRWNIRPGSYLDISYLSSHSESVTVTNADFTTIAARLRIGF